MAAKPAGAVVAACLPRDFGSDRAKELFDHLRRVAEHFDCPLIGGDISMWDHPLLLGVTVLADPAGIPPVKRGGAQPGDAIFVTGELGGSMENVDGHVHHLDFEPRIELARVLAGNADTRPRCMIDLSDGLASDLNHLCRAAGLSAEIHANDLPLSAAAYAAAHRDLRPLWRHAVGDGEDYELCFTTSADAAARMPAEISGVMVTRIGTMTPPGGEPAVTIRLPLGQSERLDGGWEHRGRSDPAPTT
jgi:thiamine-monophosphate kinase